MLDPISQNDIVIEMLLFILKLLGFWVVVFFLGGGGRGGGGGGGWEGSSPKVYI